ncbi:MAG: acyltransferase [Bacteroidales bacterium]|nr:acyltransferase [Bacteroidales bacterium]
MFNINQSNDFETLCLEIYNYQFEKNKIYNQYCRLTNRTPDKIITYKDIPFLPIEFFKSHQVICGQGESEQIFSSSGTTGMIQSKHYVQDIGLYENSFLNAWEYFYSPVSNYVVLALLPAYLERKGSSLVYMAEKMIQESRNASSGFYLFNYEDLISKVNELKASGKKILILGVTFALLDLAEQYAPDLSDCIIMETGGMKGRRKEMIREELHQQLCDAFKVSDIHSEYGMTELLSQAYSKGKGIFQTPPWMKILIRDVNDPFSIEHSSRSGGVNVIDLANLNSCSFIATQDLGKIYPDQTFEVLGRFDNSDVRGCNLMVAD